VDQLGFSGVAGLFGTEKSRPEVSFVLAEHGGDPRSGVRMRDSVLGDPTLDCLFVDVHLLG
jgi:hypothetical protein